VVSGTVKDLTGRSSPLSFKQITDQGAMYYIAQFPIEQQKPDLRPESKPAASAINSASTRKCSQANDEFPATRTGQP
jgi:hypothetical protein